MADNRFDVTAVNGPAFDAALAAARQAVADLSGPLETAARELVQRAGGNAPRRTGRLAGATRAEAASRTRVRIVADVPYAAPVHWGWPAHGIRRQPWLVATWMRDPAPVNTMAQAVQDRLDRAAALSPPR